MIKKTKKIKYKSKVKSLLVMIINKIIKITKIFKIQIKMFLKRIFLKVIALKMKKIKNYNNKKMINKNYNKFNRIINSHVKFYKLVWFLKNMEKITFLDLKKDYYNLLMICNNFIGKQ